MLAETVQDVADVINAGTYSSAITAEVTWVPKPDDKDPTLECYVWCEDVTYNRETRCPDVRFEVLSRLQSERQSVLMYNLMLQARLA